MSRVFYVYNPDTLTYERMSFSVWQRLVNFIRRTLIGVGLGAGLLVLFLYLFDSPVEKELRKENSALNAQFKVLSKRLDHALLVLEDIQQRDDNLYRVIFQADPIASSLRRSGKKGVTQFEELLNTSSYTLVVQSSQKLDLLTKQLYTQSNSFDQVVDLCKKNEEMLASTPAIQPVSNKDLKRTASGYGIRIDPFYNTPKFHGGMDFSAPIGTPVYATGGGKVIKVEFISGYGNTVMIDHGFGYQTLYGHLDKYKTTVGKTVLRGEIIAEVGSTGRSTGPHLHYEVQIKGERVNPANYYFMDLTAEEYDKMIQLAANHGKILD